jgi:hypothetical protein
MSKSTLKCQERENIEKELYSQVLRGIDTWHFLRKILISLQKC